MKDPQKRTKNTRRHQARKIASSELKKAKARGGVQDGMTWFDLYNKLPTPPSDPGFSQD